MKLLHHMIGVKLENSTTVVDSLLATHNSSEAKDQIVALKPIKAEISSHSQQHNDQINSCQKV